MVRFVDDMDQPLDRHGKADARRVISASFILAWYDGATGQYTSYTTRTQTSPITGVTAVQAAADSGRNLDRPRAGTERATSSARSLPEGFDQTRRPTPWRVYAHPQH